LNTIAVIGSRTFNDYSVLKSILDEEEPDLIVSGGAKGADLLAKRYSVENNIPIKEFLPDYKSYGKAAPIIRNKEIVNASDKVIAFWDGSSKGTQFTINYAEKYGKPFRIIEYSNSVKFHLQKELQFQLNHWAQMAQVQLAEIPSEPLSEIGEGRDSGAGATESRGSGSRDDRGIDVERNATERTLEIALPQFILLHPEQEISN
jgi:hypothetical protein